MKQAKYDVVIIGAGLGGLTAGAVLVTAGFKVLVAEKVSFVGGRCGTLEYKGFHLPTGAIWLSEEVHGDLARAVGAEFNLRVIDPPYYFRIGGKDYPAPIAGIFRTMFGYASKDEGEIVRVMKAFKRGIAWQEPSMNMSVYDWLRQYTDNEAIAGIIRAFVAMDTGLNHFELPAGEFFKFVKETSFVKRGGFLAQGGGTLTQALAKVIRDKGSDIWTRCQATQIMVRDGVAVGVRVRKDDMEDIEVSATAIACNAGPKTAVELAGKENFGEGYMKDIAKIKAAPQMIIYVESEESLTDNKGMFMWPEARRVFCALDYTGICPEVSPPGKTLLEACSYLTNSEQPYDLKSEVELSIQDLKDNIPDFDKRAKILKIICYHNQYGLMRVWAGQPFDIKTPVENLYLACDSAAPHGWWGSSAAVRSGRLTAEEIARRFKPSVAKA
ncbi:MAG: NAD(P)/FAD-dependent oxidoreductase [Chloroflexi bacterium]|nr:NAD(P)/FAD-dependent oxidoreductase [Chloroflexota bacterium]